MAVNERTRHELYEAVRQALGDDPAETLMEMLPPVGWADVATKHDLESIRDDLRSLRDRVDALPSKADVHAELNGAINRLILWLVPLLLAYGAALVRLG